MFLYLINFILIALPAYFILNRQRIKNKYFLRALNYLTKFQIYMKNLRQKKLIKFIETAIRRNSKSKMPHLIKDL